MNSKKWGPPPILTTALKLQKINQKLKYADINNKLTKAKKLLDQQIKAAEAKKHDR